MADDQNHKVSGPKPETVERMRRYLALYNRKNGTHPHPDASITEAVVLGLARNVDETGKPLCPCRFYSDKQEEVQRRTWIYACDDMQIYKYCHCLLFTTEDGLPITEYLPEGHPGRTSWGVVADPTPELGRPLRHRAAEREEERKRRS